MIERFALVGIVLALSGCASVLGATRDGDREQVARLLRAGHDPNKVEDRPEGKKGPTPLFEAIVQHDLELVKVLVEGGANVNLASECEEHLVTPVQKAALHGDLQIVRYLLEKGADPTALGSDKNVFEWLALRPEAGSAVERRAIVKTMFRAVEGKIGIPKMQAFLDEQTKSGATLLTLAIVQNDEQLAKLFIERGASIDALAKASAADRGNSDEWPPIHFAVVLERRSMVKMLEDAGASRKQTSRAGKNVAAVLEDLAQKRREEEEERREQARIARENAREEERERANTWQAMQSGLAAGMQKNASNPVDDDSFQKKMEALAASERARKERAEERERSERETQVREQREARAALNAPSPRSDAPSPRASTPAASSPVVAASSGPDAKEEARQLEAARKKDEARKKEEERKQEEARRKTELEEKKRAAEEESKRAWQSYLDQLRNGIRLRATKAFCAEGGGYCAAGSWPKGVSWKGSGSGMVNVSFRATCVSKLNWSTGTFYNFVAGGADTAPIRPKPDCPIEDVRVEVTDVRGP
jgi:ankyrin repeat protein